MSPMNAPRPAERTLIDGATLADLKRASKNLRDSVPNSALADLVDRKIRVIESPKALCGAR
jgi:hypothetical protein